MNFYQSDSILSPNSRSVYLDALRGIAILLMITGHAFVFLARNEPNIINDFVITWHMPLFAAISGFVSFRETISMESARTKVKKRLTQQILPTIVLCTIWTSTLSPASWQDTIDSMYKGGYWYTFVALELYLIYLAILLIIRHSTKTRKIQSIIFILIIIGTPLCEKLLFILGISPSCRWLVPNLFKLLPFFFLGCLLKANERFLNQLLAHKPCVITAGSIFVIGCAIVLHTELYAHSSVFVRFLSTLFPILAFLLLFLSFGKKFENHNVTIILSRYGKDSLEIYLLHFFVLASLGYLIGLDFLTDFCPDIITYLILFMISIPIASICLYISKLLMQFGIYRYIFFTEKPTPTIARPITK